MLSSVSNAGTKYSHDTWQRHRVAKNARNGDRNNMADNSKSTASLSDVALGFDTPDEFTAWLDDPSNYVERTINKVKKQVRQSPSLSATVPDDIYWSFCKTALAGDDSDEDDTVSLTYYVRQAIWTLLGRDAEYPAWAKAEAARISQERSERMSGAGAARAEKVRSLESDNQSMAKELAELRAMLDKMQSGS